MDLTELGTLCRLNNLTLTISYGSGGFCIALTDSMTNKSYSGYSWSIEGAMQSALQKLPAPELWQEEPTRPDLKIDLNRVNTSYSIINDNGGKP